MKIKEYALNTRQICFFFLAFMPVIKFFSMPSIIANVSGNDLWISVLFNIFIDGLSVFILLWFSKKENLTFFELLENTFGKNGKTAILILYIIYFLIKAVMPISEQKDYVELTLYDAMPRLLNFLPFLIVSFFLMTKKIRILGRLSDVMWAITVIGFLLIFGLSIKSSDFSELLPIGVHPLSSILKGSLYSLNWFGDGIYFLFFIGNFERKKKDTLKILSSYLLSGIFVIAFVIMFYAIFSSIAFRQRFTLTDVSKYTTVINNIGRFDYIAIFLILFSNVIAISLPLYMVNHILNELIPIKNKLVFPLVICLLYLALFTLFNEYFYSIELFAEKYACWYYFLLGNVFPIIFILFSKKGVKNVQKNYSC